jgi:NAD(P)-dependent dehydrogenase (short-subunit alcohol dehydrogenase family)
MAPASGPPRILLTGASQGIGKAILLALARAGNFVLGLSRRPPDDAPDPAPSSQSQYIAWRHLDLADGTAVANLAASLGEISIRGLILCAVDYGPGGRHSSAETSAEEWQRVIATNCTGHCILVASLLSKLAANSPGVIINISSDVALLPAAGRAAYAASKAGLHAMLSAVAAEHSINCIRVYQLVPTFQMVTRGLRGRRPTGFDFSTYADPSVLAGVVERIVSSSGRALEPGTYLVNRDGATGPCAESTHL